MTVILLLLLAVACFALLLVGLRRRDGIYRYPFLAAAVFTGFVLPQLIGLSNEGGLPYLALDKTLFMTLLCVAMVYVGDRLGTKPLHALGFDYDKSRLLIASAVLSAVGAFFFYQISRLDPELTGVSQWTGLPVAYLFFAQLMTYGLAIAALHFASTSSRWALAIIVFDLAFYFDRIFIGARRGDAAELLAIFALAAWFGRGRTVPRAAAIAVLVLGTLFLHSTGDYRAQAKEQSPLQAVASIPFRENLARLFEEGGEELRNAVYQIEASDRNLDFDYGAFQWNILVFNYVPAQLVGHGFKESLLIPVSDVAYQEFGHEGWTGSTSTGMADAFRSYWYFGSLLFLLFGYVLARIYKSAVHGNVGMQLVYMLMIVNGLHAITHHTNWFVSPWVHWAVFMLPALFYARLRKHKGYLKAGLDHKMARNRDA